MSARGQAREGHKPLPAHLVLALLSSWQASFQPGSLWSQRPAPTEPLGAILLISILHFGTRMAWLRDPSRAAIWPQPTYGMRACHGTACLRARARARPQSLDPSHQWCTEHCQGHACKGPCKQLPVVCQRSFTWCPHLVGCMACTLSVVPVSRGKAIPLRGAKRHEEKVRTALHALVRAHPVRTAEARLSMRI